LLQSALRQVAERLDVSLPDWRQLRVGLCLGTSSGGMLSAERFFDSLAQEQVPSSQQAAAATYFAPFEHGASWLRAAIGDRALAQKMQVVAACASSTIAIGLAMRWLQRDACDLVLAGGYDGVSRFVAAGFEKLRATSATTPKPFREGRDGMALGEGAGIVAMSRLSFARERVREPIDFALSGFGASCDAVHITAPDRTGGGLRRAAEAALGDAGCDAGRVDLVSAHGTATPYNDAMESKAIAAVCSGPPPYVHAFKAQIGHTLGAAGVLELLAATESLRLGLAPPTCGDGPPAEDAPARLADIAEEAVLGCALKLSAAFGGVTAALVAERVPREVAASAPPRAVRLVAHEIADTVDRERLAERCGMARDRIARIDPLGQLALEATAALVAGCGREAIEGAGIVAGYSLATLETNRRFYERLAQRGPRWVDPRLFPATSPNSGAGHCAIAYQLTGPCFAVCGGLAGSLEAVAAASELIRAGDADRMIVVAADDDGPAVRAWLELCGGRRSYASGAVALLLDVADPLVSTSLLPEHLDVDHDHGPIGQLALRAWLARAHLHPATQSGTHH
jgi:3-oxoacyl-[acyl-carrier-protein] synthase-1/3-oxoacyl-[acyl-carrier-protein] synthase II